MPRAAAVRVGPTPRLSLETVARAPATRPDDLSHETSCGRHADLADRHRSGTDPTSPERRVVHKSRWLKR